METTIAKYGTDYEQFETGLPNSGASWTSEDSAEKMRILLSLIFLCANSALADEIPTTWDYLPVGECIKNYKVPKPTADYPMTVQLIKNGDVRKSKYVWIWDPTPEKNPTRQLVRVTQKGVGCTILFMPFSEFHNFKLTSNGELPEKVTSISATVNDDQGAYFFEQDYVLDKHTGFYQKFPTCYKVKVGRADREKTNCQTAADG